MKTTITIGTATYAASDRAAGRFVGIDALTLSCDEYSSLEFSIQGCGPAPPFNPGIPVALTVANDDGTHPVIAFVGDIIGPVSSSPGDGGYTFAYHCLDMKHRADYIPIRSAQGTAACLYNLPPDELGYDPDRAGKTVGDIVKDVLQAYDTATDLFNAGVGGFTFGTDGHGNPIATLGAITVADLALLAIVPQYGCRIEGDSILSTLDQFIRDHHPQMSMWVQPDGSIRVGSPLNFTPFPLVVPGATGTGDDVEFPDWEFDDSNCFTQYQIIGRDLTGTFLSTSDGTITPVNTAPDRLDWTLADFVQPKGYSDQGAVSITSSTSATVTSDDITITWLANFWETNSGFIVLVKRGGAGVEITERRPVSLSGAMTAGGSASIEWDSSLPLDSEDYGRYYLIATNAPLAYVDRLFNVTDPSTGHIGTDTFVGANMVDRDPEGIPWGNNQQGGLVFYPTARALWSLHGDDATVANRFPFDEVAIFVKLLKNTGQILLSEPAVLACARLAGSDQALTLGYPTTAYGGLWADLQVAVPYTRGPLVAQYPTSGFSGTAYTVGGLTRVKKVFLDSFVSRSQMPAMLALAQEHQITMGDVTVEGAILHHDIPSGFSPFGIGFALNISFGGEAGPLDGVNLPVRTTVIRWPSTGGDIVNCSFRFSNRKAPFAADSHYLRPDMTRDSSNNLVTFEAAADHGDWVIDNFTGHEGRQERLRARTRPQEQPGFVGPPSNLMDPRARLEADRGKNREQVAGAAGKAAHPEGLAAGTPIDPGDNPGRRGKLADLRGQRDKQPNSPAPANGGPLNKIGNNIVPGLPGRHSIGNPGESTPAANAINIFADEPNPSSSVGKQGSGSPIWQMPNEINKGTDPSSGTEEA
jgi:hypothetical protein